MSKPEKVMKGAEVKYIKKVAPQKEKSTTDKSRSATAEQVAKSGVGCIPISGN